MLCFPPSCYFKADRVRTCGWVVLIWFWELFPRSNFWSLLTALRKGIKAVSVLKVFEFGSWVFQANLCETYTDKTTFLALLSLYIYCNALSIIPICLTCPSPCPWAQSLHHQPMLGILSAAKQGVRTPTPWSSLSTWPISAEVFFPGQIRDGAWDKALQSPQPSLVFLQMLGLFQCKCTAESNS